MTELSRGSLTTTFTAPSACSSDFTRIYFVSTSNGWFLAQGPVSLGSCFPSGFGAQENEFYSPGLCPSGYSTACSRLNHIGTVSETIFTCCPTNIEYRCRTTFSEDAVGFGGCKTELSSGTTWRLLSVYVLESGSTSIVPTTTGLVGAIGAHSIQVRVQSTDFTTTFPETISSAIESTSTAPETSTTGLDTQSDTQSDMQNAPKTLSTGAAVGIAIAAAAIVIGIIAASIILFRKKRKARHRPLVQELPGEGASGASGANYQWAPVELPGDSTRPELPWYRK